MSIKNCLLAGALALASVSGLAVAAHAQEEVTITIWSLDKPEQPAWNLAREFDEKEPGIKVEYRLVQFDDVVSEAKQLQRVGIWRCIYAGSTPFNHGPGEPLHRLSSQPRATE